MMSGTEALGDGKPSPDSVIVGLAESNFDDDDGIMNAPTHLSSSSADGFPDQLMDGEDEDSVDGAEGFSADPGLEGGEGLLPYISCDPRSEVRIRLEVGDGDGLARQDVPVTVLDRLRDRVRQTPDSYALAMRQDSGAPFEFMTYADLYDEVVRFAVTMIAVGVKPCSAVTLAGANSTQWVVASIGAMAAKCFACSVFKPSLPNDFRYVVEHSQSRIVFCGLNRDAWRLVSWVKSVKTVAFVVVYLEDIDPGLRMVLSVPIYTWDEFMANGQNSPMRLEIREHVLELMDSASPGGVAGVCYTPGTTGVPKAVMLSHDSITWTAKAVVDHVEEYKPFADRNRGRILSYLPLASASVQMLDIHVAMLLGYCTYFDLSIDIYKATAGDALLRGLRFVRPTVLFGVCKVWENLHKGIMSRIQPENGRSIKGALIRWAQRRILEAGVRAEMGLPPPAGWRLALRIVSKVKRAIGLDQTTHCFVSAAKRRFILSFFKSLDILIHESIGCTETSGVHSLQMRPAGAEASWCDVPPVCRGLTIEEDRNGELLIGGRSIMMGYMYDKMRTLATFTPGGLLRTGIMNMPKPSVEWPRNTYSGFNTTAEVMSTSAIANIENLLYLKHPTSSKPVRIYAEAIERDFVSTCPAAENVIAVGNGRPYVVLLITLQTVVNDAADCYSPNFTESTNAMSAAIGSKAATTFEAEECPRWASYLSRCIDHINTRAIDEFHHVQRWRIIPENFSHGTGEITPIGTSRRFVILNKFSSRIDELYVSRD